MLYREEKTAFLLKIDGYAGRRERLVWCEWRRNRREAGKGGGGFEWEEGRIKLL